MRIKSDGRCDASWPRPPRTSFARTASPRSSKYNRVLYLDERGEAVRANTSSVFLPRQCYRQKTCSICAIVIPVLGCVYVGVRRVCVLYLLTCRSRRRRHVGRSDQSSICFCLFLAKSGGLFWSSRAIVSAWPAFFTAVVDFWRIFFVRSYRFLACCRHEKTRLSAWLAFFTARPSSASLGVILSAETSDIRISKVFGQYNMAGVRKSSP